MDHSVAAVLPEVDLVSEIASAVVVDEQLGIAGGRDRMALQTGTRKGLITVLCSCMRPGGSTCSPKEISAETERFKKRFSSADTSTTVLNRRI